MARVDIIRPQMGESIAEGTLSKWLKKVGDDVKRDEPIFEISTDKVDAEIPAPAAGVLAEILVKEGETVAVQTVVARLETEKGAAVGTSAPPAASGVVTGSEPATTAKTEMKTGTSPPSGKVRPRRLNLVSHLPRPPSPHHTPATATPSRIESARNRPRSCEKSLPSTGSTSHRSRVQVSLGG